MGERSLHTTLSVIVVAVALLAAWLLSGLSPALDVTATDRHSLNHGSIQAARALEEPLDILAVIGPEPQARLALRTLIDRYRAVKPDIELTLINPETDPTRARELQAAPGGELILRTPRREQRLQTLSERSFTGALRQLGRESQRTIAFLTGHGERSPLAQTNDDWSVLAERLASIGLQTREHSLVSDPELADDIDVLVVAGPGSAWFPGETRALSTWLADGGHLLWLVDTPLDTATGAGFDSIGLQLGVERLPGQVIDTKSQEMDLGSPTFVVLDTFMEHPVTRTLSSPVLLPGATAFKTTPLAGQDVMPLLQTPASSWSETSELAGAVRFEPGSDETEGPLLLGLTIEREIAGKPQHIAILGDADFASSQFLGNGANQAFAEALMLWLTGDSNEADFVTPVAPDAELALERRTIIVLTVGLLAALPLGLLLVAGVLAWRRRH